MKVDKLIGIGLLLFAIGFSLWIYRMEPTALTDPNDNTFQYALVDRTNQVWDAASQFCSGITKPFCMASHLTDHWVPNWAEGYNLPYYYSHIPQIVIVTTYRLLSQFSIFISQFSLKIINFKFQISLFQYYHWVIYLLLCFFPLFVFAALRVIRLSPVMSGIGAIIASHLSTDGLYGLDPSSFLWRGFGLSSQLFSMIWLPLALAYAFQLFTSTSNETRQEKNTNHHSLSFHYYLFTIIFLTLTTAGHLGIGIIAFLSVGILAISPLIQSILTRQWDKKTTQSVTATLLKLVIIFGSVGLILGYWILPILKDGAYHNISVWDGIWKFDSFGYREVLSNFINGNLFDFGRFPTLTILVIIGLFSALFTIHYSPFAYLFLFWLLMYFGRVTWGGLFNLIPGMNEFHLSRFIVGVHIAGIFLIPIGIDWLVSTISSYVPRSRQFITVLLCQFVILVVLVSLVFPQTLRYASHNDFLIARANENFRKVQKDTDLLFAAIKKHQSIKPGRVFAGRGGSWGKNFRVAETPMYMYLSTYGIPVVLWLPETWSPNSDTEQYFSEGSKDHYSLYNVSLVATPVDLADDQIQPFWKLIEAGKSWKLYDVRTNENNENNENNTGYITTGVKPAVVSSDKEHFRSVVRLWMHSGTPKQHLFPELTFDPNYPKTTGLPNFRMMDEVTFKVPDLSIHNVFAEVPRYVSPLLPKTALPVVVTQSSQNDMTFNASIDIKEQCNNCLVILKQSFHPSWRVTVDGNDVTPFAVFPFFTAITIESPGNHDVVFSYQPSYLKRFLLFIGCITCGGILWLVIRAYNNTHKG